MKLLFLIPYIFINLYSEKIELKDGTVIYGNFEGIIEDNYVVRTKYGVLSIKRDDIINPPQIDDTLISKINHSTTSVNELKIITSKKNEMIEKKFYEGDTLTATQIFSLTSSSPISTSGYIKDGIYYEYDENGNLISEKTIKNGIENGPVIEFYPNGIIKSRIDYKNGKIDGKVHIYSEDGRLILEQSYSNGVLDGFTTEYDLDGNIKSRILYSMGKLSDNVSKNEESLNQNKTEKNELENLSEFSTKMLNLARTKKIFVYKNKKYIGSFTIDTQYNMIDVTGDIPNSTYEIKDGENTLVFDFKKNIPVSLKVIKAGGEITKYSYDEDGKAMKNKE
jgi:antitoxin component YwqK of YwqJK toxin-antitoxin module